MSMVPGDADCTMGLSKRIYDYWTTDARAGFAPDFATSPGKQGSVKAICYAVARGVVDEITANAYVDGHTVS